MIDSNFVYNLALNSCLEKIDLRGNHVNSEAFILLRELGENVKEIKLDHYTKV